MTQLLPRAGCRPEAPDGGWLGTLGRSRCLPTSMRAYLAAGATCLLGACDAARPATPPSLCSGFRNAEGPYATLRAPFTTLPPAVQFEAERDVISLGEVPRVVVRAGNAGVGRFNETSEFTVTNPDGSRNDGPCDSAREPETSAAKVPLLLASRMSEDHARTVKYVFEADDGWVVMFDHGEFGGGIEWYARAGGPPRSVFVGPRERDDFVPQNVNRALAADGVIYVLQGIAHMGISEGQLAKIWREHDHFTSHVIARYASEPVDWIRRDDGNWFVATWNAIWETREGAPSTVVANLPDVMQYPTSLARAANGTFFVGTRGGVVRLAPVWPDAPRYAADFLWEAGGHKRDCSTKGEATE